MCGLASPGRVKDVELYAIAIIFLLGPILTRWLNRDIHFRKLGGQPGRIQRLSDGVCLRVRLDAVHRADPGGSAGGGGDARKDRARSVFCSPAIRPGWRFLFW